MQIGISITSRYDVQDVRMGARAMIQRAQAAAAAGLDSLFLGDHHVTPAPYYQNTPMLARMLAEWRAAPAGALYLLPLHHPVILAEQIGTLACIAPGRFILQCAIGYGEREFAALGVNPTHRPSRFEESLSVMRRLWAGERISHEGRWRFDDAYIAPVPPEPVEVWIAAQAPPAIDRAARLGDGWLAAPGLTPAQAAKSLALYRSACAAHGRPVGVCAIRRDIYVGDNGNEAARIGGAVVSTGYRGFSPDATIVGEPAEVAERFAAFKEMGFDTVIVRNLVSEQHTAIASIQRLKEVKHLLAA